MSVSAIPEGYHSVTPYLIVSSGVDAIAFYEKAFGASELLRLEIPGGGIAHAEVKIGNSPVMLADENPEMGALCPTTLGGAGASLCVYVEDCDALFAQAVAAGAQELSPVQDQFYGDRSGTVKDPFGHVWTLASHVEDLDQDEIQRRMMAQFGA